MKNNKQKIGDLGQHWTPASTVGLMCGLMQNKGSILEPSVGSGRFLSVLPDAHGCEIDPSVIEFDNNNITIGNFFDYSLNNTYDTIIGNPPYVQGKLLEPSWFGSWEGKLPKTANAYFHFIEKCLSHLNPGGELIFIVPSSLLSGSSLGSKLRKMMMERGTFTHIIDSSDTKWAEASVNTVIFRYQLGATCQTVLFNGESKALIHQEGFVWIVDYDYAGFFGDHFKITVGSCPRKQDFHDNGATAHYYDCGNMVPVDETYKSLWPRVRNTPKQAKIFYNSGPTRKWPNFWKGDAEKHLSYCMIPKMEMSDDAADKVNQWFKDNGESLGLIQGGRWNVGVKQLSTIPFPTELEDIITKDEGLLAFQNN